MFYKYLVVFEILMIMEVKRWYWDVFDFKMVIIKIMEIILNFLSELCFYFEKLYFKLCWYFD